MAMQTPLQPFNPFEIWSTAALAGAAAMTAAVEATRAATTSWLPPDTARPAAALPATATFDVAQPTQPVAHAHSEELPQSAPSIFSFFATALSPVAEPERAPRLETFPRTASAPRTETAGKSWYRAPYRSPFDPMFWLSPGHPVDHVPEWMVMTGVAAMMPGTTSAAATGWPMPKPPLWPANPWNADIWASNPWGNIPWSSNPLTAIARTPTPIAQNSSLANPWPSNPWTAWLDASNAGWSSLSAPAIAPSNVVDFTQAYSTYRTAGGHASAQLSRASDTTKVAREAAQSTTTAIAFPDAWTNLMWPWLSKN